MACRGWWVGDRRCSKAWGLEKNLSVLTFLGLQRAITWSYYLRRTEISSMALLVIDQLGRDIATFSEYGCILANKVDQLPTIGKSPLSQSKLQVIFYNNNNRDLLSASYMPNTMPGAYGSYFYLIFNIMEYYYYPDVTDEGIGLRVVKELSHG